MRQAPRVRPTYGADLGDDARPLGGCIPIFVDGELAGTVATSGEPDVADHEATAETVWRHLELRQGHEAGSPPDKASGPSYQTAIDSKVHRRRLMGILSASVGESTWRPRRHPCP